MIEEEPSVPPSIPKKRRKRKLLGFPSIINKQLAPLNSNPYFQEHHKDDHFDLLLIAKDDRRAAIVHVSDGKVTVDQIKNKPETINPIKKEIKPRIETDITTFLGLAMGKVNPVKAVLKRKLKIRKLRTVLKFTKYFSILAHIQKEQKKVENIN